MPRRSMPLITGEVYHIFNRGIDRRPTFTTFKEYTRGLEALDYYRFEGIKVKLSRYLTLPEDERNELKHVMSEKKYVSIYAYCLMPNHFHILLRQESEGGISRFLSQFQNSYVRYFNTRHERIGQLFLVQFKSVRIETDEQLLHVSRYIHLNPYTSHILKTMEETFSYPWSSLAEYLGMSRKHITSTEMVLEHFRDIQAYKQFVADQAAYQRDLDKIKHLTFE